MSESESLQTCRLYEFSVFHLDVNEGLFAGSEPVKLAPKVLQTLTLFVENPGRIITKDEFFEKIWTDSFVEDGALSFNISRLRKALAEFDKDTEFIETVSKRGFRFIADVREVRPDNSDLEILIERHQVREVLAEETEYGLETDTQPKLKAPTRSRIKTAVFILVTILMLGGLAGFGLRQYKKNAQLRSADDWTSVDLPISWRSAGSSGYARYSSSHDGNMVAYSSTEDGISESIFVAQLTGGEKIRITKDSWRNFSPVWSPNDGELAFVSVREARFGIYICPFLGGPPRLVSEVEPGDLSLRSWSKDGSAIFYEVNGNLFNLNITSGELSQVTGLPEVKAYRRNFAISVDEDRIAFCDETNGQKDLWTMPINGGAPVQLTNTADEEFRSSWHPDGKRIFYSVSRKGHYQIDAAFSDGSDPIQITRGDGKYELIDVSSDGTRIFYQRWRDKSDIWEIRVNSGEEFPIASEPESEFWPDVSQEGTMISYQTNSAEYVPQEMSKSTIIVRSVNDKHIQHSFRGYGQKWLQDGRRIAFFRRQDTSGIDNLWIFDTVNGSESEITSEGAASPAYSPFPFHRSQTADFGWSPNTDKFIYLDSVKQNIWMVSLAEKAIENLTNNDDPDTRLLCPIWSPDGTRVAYVARPVPTAQQQLWKVWIWEGGNRREIFQTLKSLRFLGWSPAGDYLFYEMTDGPMAAGFIDIELLKVSLKGDAKIIGSFEQISAPSMTLSIDGEAIVYVSHADGKDNIYKSSTIKKDEKKLTSNIDPGLRFASLRWSPDGETIFVDKQEELNVISMFQNFEK